MSKNFKTYNQQLRHLKDKKKIACNGSSDKILLIEHGYFNIINGYKVPFINSKESNRHIYHTNTTLSQIASLKNFDDKLREHILKYLIRIEEQIRTLFAYKFDEINDNGAIPWFMIEAYRSSANPQYVMTAITSAYSQINKNRSEYKKHYIDRHRVIPTWIMTKIVSFDTLIKLLQQCKSNVLDSLCDLYQIRDKHNEYDHKLLVGSLHWIRKIRNACAHNERIYSIRHNKSRIYSSYFQLLSTTYNSYGEDKCLIDLIVYFRYYLCNDDYDEFIDGIENLIQALKTNIIPTAFERVRTTMGIRQLSHLEVLKNLTKDIELSRY